MTKEFYDGSVLLIDKPHGWTSFDVVNKIRFAIRKKSGIKALKVGHAGTLDPMATGLLVLCTGKFTKQIQSYQGLDKWYDAEITFGKTTDSYDAEGKVLTENQVPPFTKDDIERWLPGFTGTTQQIPPVFSAIKKNGNKAYELARAGKEVKMEPRTVHVHSLSILDWQNPVLKIRIHCGSGYYVRSLAHDLGGKAGCGAYLTGLVRTQIGDFSLENALSVTEFVARVMQE